MTHDFLNGLLAEIQRRFYAKVEARAFYAHRRQLIRAVTWPAVWWRKRGFRTELPPDRYRGVILEVLTGIEGHGDQVKIKPAEMGGSGFFPAYLLKCIQQHYGHQGESLYYSAKPLRDAGHVAIAGGSTLGDCVDLDAIVGRVRAFSSRTRDPRPQTQNPGPLLDLDELARAHALIATPKRAPKTERGQGNLF